MYFSIYLLSVLLNLVKHVKLIVFENYNECKTKYIFDIKSSDTVWLKIATWRKKSIDEEKKESSTAYPREEDPISEDLKANPTNEKPQENPYHCET